MKKARHTAGFYAGNNAQHFFELALCKEKEQDQ